MKKIDLTQKLCNVLNIVSKVIMYVSFIVSALLLVYLLITFVINAAFALDVLGSDLPSDLIDLQAYVALAIINIFASGLLAKSFSKYLKKELEDGTPFVKESAVMLRSVGIKGVVLTVVSSVLSIIILCVFMLIAKRNYFQGGLDFERTNFIGLSIVLIAISILLEAGCESIGKIEE